MSPELASLATPSTSYGFFCGAELGAVAWNPRARVAFGEVCKDMG